MVLLPDRPPEVMTLILGHLHDENVSLKIVSLTGHRALTAIAQNLMLRDLRICVDFQSTVDIASTLLSEVYATRPRFATPRASKVKQFYVQIADVLKESFNLAERNVKNAVSFGIASVAGRKMTRIARREEEIVELFRNLSYPGKLRAAKLQPSRNESEHWKGRVPSQSQLTSQREVFQILQRSAQLQRLIPNDGSALLQPFNRSVILAVFGGTLSKIFQMKSSR
ncbi:hypothetical protein BDZ89DRAFT_1118986 [Hymenopellis radicata]|nr:hypothetical protein BDZ89DRAFT_1118986 [Hymenopellis radicata]